MDPTSTGSFNVSVKASNGVSPDATQSYTLTIQEAQMTNCPSSLISYWKLDETSGNVYSDYAGSNNATSTNTPIPSLGRVNGAQQFNGTSNRITIAANPDYDWNASSSFTFEAWIKHVAVAYTVNEYIVGRKDNSNLLSAKLQLTPQILWGVRSKLGNESYELFGPNLYDNTWHHVVGVKDGTLNQLRLYVDGTLIGSVSASYTSGFDSPTAPITIGWKDLTGDESYFEGSIDEVAVYGEALSASTISQHYLNGLQNLGYCLIQTQNTPPSISSSPNTSAIAGQQYSYDVDASGNPSPTHLLTTAPSGMSINSSTGLIQWTPTSTGSFNVSVKAANGVSPDATQSYTLTVQGNQTGGCSPNLISYWKLDETSGNIFADYVGTNNASTTNRPTSITGRVNSGQQFNGTSNYLGAPRIASYDFGVNTSFTFEAWIKHVSGSYLGEEIIVERKAPNSNLAVNLKFAGTRTISFSARNLAGEVFTATGTTVLYDNNWHHVVGVRDAVTNQLKVYVDGILERTVSAVYTGGFASATEGISIGWRNSTEDKFFNGSLDEVAIYNSALDASSITQHYNNGLVNLGYCQVLTAPAIVTVPSTSVELGQMYVYDVDASGVPDPIYSLVTAPSGMTIDSISGFIEWTPSAIGDYPLTVKASNGVTPDATQSFSIYVYQLIQAPSNLTAALSTIDSNNVKLAWEDNSINESGFVIERKMGDSLSVEPYTILGAVLADVITYEDTTVADTTLYTYRVYALNADTISDYSNQAEIVSAVPVEFTLFTATLIGGEVLLEWETATETNNIGFTVQRSNDGARYIDLGFVNGKGTTTNKSLYNFIDNSVLSGKYFYRLKQIDFDGTLNYSKSVYADLGQVNNFSLEQNYPNPFNPSTKIRFAVPLNSRVRITIYNQLGEIIAQPVDNYYDAGAHEVEVDMKNLASGIYFYKISAGPFSEMKKMVLAK